MHPKKIIVNLAKEALTLYGLVILLFSLLFGFSIENILTWGEWYDYQKQIIKVKYLIDGLPTALAYTISIYVGVLGFYVNIKYATSGGIIQPITNLNTFIWHSNKIIQDELERKKTKETDSAPASVTQRADLIILLWLPFYKITYDMGRLSEEFLDTLRSARSDERSHTVFISTKNPLVAIQHLIGPIDDEKFQHPAFKSIALGEKPDDLPQEYFESTADKWGQIGGPNNEVRVDRLKEFLNFVALMHQSERALAYDVVGVEWDDIKKINIQCVMSSCECAIIIEWPEIDRASNLFATRRRGYETIGFWTSDETVMRHITQMLRSWHVGLGGIL